MAFICGSFNNQEEEEDFKVLWPYPDPYTPSRKTKKHRCCCRSRKKETDKNPYSNRGLDKFEALLADLDDKKQKIFTQKGSQYISFVRFVYSNSNDVKPIIVRLRDPRKHEKDRHHKQTNLKDTKSSQLFQPDDHTLDHSEPPSAGVTNGDQIKTQEEAQVLPILPIGQITKKINIRVDHHQWKVNMKKKLEWWWMPSYNLPLFVILVLVFLTFLGRSLAIICTSIAWYMIPTIDGTLESTTTTKPKKMMIKNMHSRKPSENNKMVSSPKAFLSGPINVDKKHTMKKLTSF